MHSLLGEYDAFHKLRIIDGATKLLYNLHGQYKSASVSCMMKHSMTSGYLDVCEIDVGRGLGINDLEDGINGDGCQQIGILRHDLCMYSGTGKLRFWAGIN